MWLCCGLALSSCVGTTAGSVHVNSFVLLPMNKESFVVCFVKLQNVCACWCLVGCKTCAHMSGHLESGMCHLAQLSSQLPEKSSCII